MNKPDGGVVAAFLGMAEAAYRNGKPFDPSPLAVAVSNLRAELEQTRAQRDAYKADCEAVERWKQRADNSDSLTRAMMVNTARTEAQATNNTPIDMVLHCPRCHQQHIDAPKPCGAETCEQGCALPGNCVSWANPPHRSHRCAYCGLIWRPADVATNGVAATKTRGSHDHPASMVKQPSLIGHQITDATFDAPNPNPEHIAGVQYDPRQRCAFVQGADRRWTRGRIGDWIVLDEGQPKVLTAHARTKDAALRLRVIKAMVDTLIKEGERERR